MAQASILIIEPDVTIAHLLAQVLEEDGYTVACATSRDDALALLRAGGPDAFRVVLSYAFADVEPAPYTWLDRLRAHTHAPIVTCTRYPATLYADDQARGYATVIEEPCDLREVLDAVAALCSESAPAATHHPWQPCASRAGHHAE
jgi:CheY-like chemotaxis protein